VELAGGWGPLALNVDPMGPNLMFEYTTCALALCASTVGGAPEVVAHVPRLESLNTYNLRYGLETHETPGELAALVVG
jgi:hypothetical protein